MIIILLVLLLAAGITTEVFFWKRFTNNNRNQQQLWQTKVDDLSAQISHQQDNLTALQNQFAQFVRNQQQNQTAQALNEIAYLLDIANLYLQINHDITNAIKSLQLAQQRLKVLADPSLIYLQQALASDLNTLNDAPKVDAAEILLKLQTLSESISRLPLIPQQVTPVAPETKASPEKSQQTWYKKSLREAWSSFKKLFVIRYNAPTRVSILPPDQRESIRENIAFTLSQAQWAVLQQKSTLYHQSLDQVQTWLNNYYPDNAERKQILARLTELTAINIAATPPDINASLAAVQKALKQLAIAPTPAENIPAKPEINVPLPSPAPPPSEKPHPPAGIEI